MYGSGNQPVIVLKEGTERSKDKEAQFNNIAAAKAVADAVRSTLGPKGISHNSSSRNVRVNLETGTIYDTQRSY